MNWPTSFAMWAAAPLRSGRRPFHAAAHFAVYPAALSAHDPSATEEAETVAAMLASIKSGDRVTTAGGIRGTILSIKDDSIMIRVAPDNLKLEVAKNAIASVTTRSFESEPSGLLSFGLEKRNDEEESQEQNCPDHCGSSDLPVWHLRNPIGDQRKGVAERHVQPDSSWPRFAGRGAPDPASAGVAGGECGNR